HRPLPLEPLMPSRPSPAAPTDAATPSDAADQPGVAKAACPVTSVGDIIFSRWTAPILWTLGQNGTLRFNALHRLIPDVTPKILTSRLRQLERDGLVVRTYHPDIPPRVEYGLSELGQTLSPVFHTLVDWSRTHLSEVESARGAYDRARAAEDAWAEG
ncbi:winged helix-turn-helix transcriptional regulator, partial [Streptomyces sp. URMC 123]|uniref:winged helix-turn-helix transcriptional regulator n=1 Tax=Streptomyces sp. URMC 123 TaxID=3423403 RepID=UPI003F1C0B29